MKIKKEIEDRFVLPADDLAIRKIYINLLKNEVITTLFRPGTRNCHDFRGYCPGDIVNARIIDHLGLDRAKIAPIFLDSPIKKVLIETVDEKTIGSLLAKDFIGAPPNVHDKLSLIHELGLIYNLAPTSLLDDAVITRIHFSFIH